MRKNTANRSLTIPRLILVLCICLSSTVLFAAPAVATKNLKKNAQEFLTKYISEHHVLTGREGLSLVDSIATGNNNIKVRFTQTIDDIPVDGVGLVVYVNANTGVAYAVKGDFINAGDAIPKFLNGKTSIIDALARQGIFNPALISKPMLVFINSEESEFAVPVWRSRAFFVENNVRKVRDVYVNAASGAYISSDTISNEVPSLGSNHIRLSASNQAKVIGSQKTTARKNGNDAWFDEAPMAPVLPNCGNDADADCLNDSFEDWLGATVAPILFYDEDESCTAGIEADFRGETDESHFDRKDFFQVRPRYYDVANWDANDGKLKTVVVTYIFAYPHDCQTPLFGWVGGHQGDIEKVNYTLQSRDLKTWDLVEGHYRHHGDGKTVSGDIIRGFAEELGLNRPIIAVSEDSHASYYGTWTDPESAICDPDGDHELAVLGIGRVDDCFCKMPDGSNGSPQECLNETTKEQGRWINLADSLLANIGEPEQFRLGEFLEADGNGGVYTEFDVGHGLVREYWSKVTPDEVAFGDFCGWQCPNSERLDKSEKKTCAFKIHGETRCVGPLSGKIDSVSFSVDPLPNNDPTPECNSNTPKPSKDCDDVLNPM